MEKLFETRFENKRDTPVVVLEYGKILLTLQPGAVRHIESRSAGTTYASFSEIVFLNGDKVNLTRNKAWTFPWPDKLMLEVLNTDGANSESLYFDKKCLDFYKGIPRFVPIAYDDSQWYAVERLEKKFVEKKIKDGDFLVRKMVLENVKYFRSKREIKAIEQRVLAEATAKAEKETKAQFHKPTGTGE